MPQNNTRNQISVVLTYFYSVSEASIFPKSYDFSHMN